MKNYVYETIVKIEQLTGMSLDELLRKLVAGWTLEPPKTKAISFSELRRLCDSLPDVED